MGLTQEMRQDIEMLTMVVADDVEIAKALQRKYGKSVPAIEVHKYRKAIATELPPTKVDKPVKQSEESLPDVSRDQAPIVKQTSLEVGSTMLMAAICRLAFKRRRLLPNLTLEEQRERARADGYSGSIEGWA